MLLESDSGQERATSVMSTQSSSYHHKRMIESMGDTETNCCKAKPSGPKASKPYSTLLRGLGCGL